MKQVNPKYYDQKYFQFQSSSPDFSKKIKSTDFHKKYKEITSLINLKSTDSICDYGCGNGDLAFLLYLQHHCQITAIDYSPDAIKICKSKLNLFKKNTSPKCTIKFLNKDNKNIPKLKNIKAVYFCDVFEHLYPHEIEFIVKKVSQWGNPNIIVHTDNNLYLRYILPLTHFLAILTRKTTIKELKKEIYFHKKRHVNLTNPKKLNKNMISLGYCPNKIQYPQIDKKIIRLQLGNLSKFNLIVDLAYLILKTFPFFSPSFYALYTK